jgi:hypothetical protein
MSSSVLLLAVLCSALVFALAEIVNKDVVRVIDGSSAIVKTTIDIKAEGVQGEYILILANAQAEALAYLSVTSQGQELVVNAPVMSVSL